MCKKKLSLKLKYTPHSDNYKKISIELPHIFDHLKLNWNEIYDNLSIDAREEQDKRNTLKEIFNKFYYSDKNNKFHKSFGVKSTNLYDLSLTSINKIVDRDIVVDEYGYAFSYYDLKKIPEKSFHPYIKLVCIDQTYVYKSPITIPNYFQRYMNIIGEKRLSNNSMLPDVTDSDTDDVNELATIFERLIDHDFFTINLVTIYQQKTIHLDYTIALAYYVLAVLDDFGERYKTVLKDAYWGAEDKYLSFLQNYIAFLRDIKRTNNLEKYQYICIIIFKILQYRFNVINEGEELYSLIKGMFRSQYHDELYWSIILDRPNFYYQSKTSLIKLININIDIIFSNCEFPEYFFTLMTYLHDKYMNMPTRDIDDELVTVLNHYKVAEYYSYLDVIKYFMDLHHTIKNNSDAQQFYLYRRMLKRYYLKSNPIHITGQGLICD